MPAPRWGLVPVVLLAAAIRLGFGLLPLERVDRLFVPDDTYYTLAIARALAHGAGPTADGVTMTSGFQPLLGFVLAPVFLFPLSADGAVRVAVLLTAIFDVAVVALLYRLAARTWGNAAGFAAALFWAISPLAIANALGGLETSLALCAVLLLLDRFAAFEARPSAAGAAIVGAVAAACWLARVDTAAVIAMVTAIAIVRRTSVSSLAIAAVAFIAIVSPWWIYELRRFGSIVPESGAAVRTQVAFHQALYLTPASQAAWAAGYLTPSPFAEVRAWRDLLFASPAAGPVVFGGCWLIAALLLYRSVQRTRRIDGAHVLCAFGLIVAVFYTFYVPALWFFRRYLAPAELSLALAWGVVIAGLVRRGS